MAEHGDACPTHAGGQHDKWLVERAGLLNVYHRAITLGNKPYPFLKVVSIIRLTSILIRYETKLYPSRKRMFV